MSALQKHPLKLYIQDIFRAKRTEANKYYYEIFGNTFKNIMIHGVITSMYNTRSSYTNFELTDATGSVQVYYNSTKKNTSIGAGPLNNIRNDVSKEFYYINEHKPILDMLYQSILATYNNPIGFHEGDYVQVVGDLFVDDFKSTRMVSGYECQLSSVERDIVWMEELQYLYEKFYLWKRI